LRKNKARKFVRIENPLELPIRSQPVEVSGVQVADAEAVESMEIKDLCAVLHSLESIPDKSECLGYLCAGERYHELRKTTLTHSGADQDSYISLETLLSAQYRPRLSRQQRYRLASIFASSLLQLQTTPWLADMLEKKNIFFYQNGTAVLLDQPYIQQTFPTSQNESMPRSPATSQPSTYAARNSLTSLGILLLELCFGQPIENQDFRKSHLGADGKSHSGTNFLTAIDWAETVGDEEPALEPIIRCCIFCMFEEKADWENKKFTQAVYTGVVEPLDNFVMKWS